MNVEDVQHLAALSRIAITDEEAASLAAEFDDILGYVAQVTEISADKAAAAEVGAHANVLRQDIASHEPGAYTDALLAAAPQREGRYVVVKKILGKNDAG